MAQSGIALIAGLGNPGNQYAESRHNAGFWLLQLLQQQYGFTLENQKRYKGLIGGFETSQRSIKVLAPQTFMNLSGDSVVPYARFFKIPVEQILVVYDEVDLAPGVIRLKLGGGHGGHNGLRDIMQKSGVRSMQRLRIGIGHPGASHQVAGYVLSAPSSEHRMAIERAMQRALEVLPDIINGDVAKAMHTLHTE